MLVIYLILSFICVYVFNKIDKSKLIKTNIALGWLRVESFCNLSLLV